MQTSSGNKVQPMKRSGHNQYEMESGRAGDKRQKPTRGGKEKLRDTWY